MRILMALLFILAGCTSPADVQSDMKPVSGDPLGERPDDLAIAASGEMLQGVDQTFEFDLDPRVTSFIVSVDVTRDFYADPATEVLANLFHNGTFIAGTGASPSNTVSLGNGQSTLLNFEARLDGQNATLSHLTGAWVVDVQGNPQLGSYSVSIVAKYE